jgi:hypothetical protein
MNIEEQKKLGKLPGEMWAFLAVLVAIPLGIIAAVLHGIVWGFDPFNWWISNLGVVHLNYEGQFSQPTPIPRDGDLYALALLASTFFKIAIITAGIGFFHFWIALFKLYWRSESKKGGIYASFGLFFGLISSISMIFVAFFDMYHYTAVHVITAFIFFFPGYFATLFFTLSMWANNSLNWFQLMLEIILTVLLGLFIPVFSAAVKTYLPGTTMLDLTFHSWVDVMSNMTPALSIIRFLEWLATLLMFGWLLYTGWRYRQIRLSIK